MEISRDVKFLEQFSDQSRENYDDLYPEQELHPSSTDNVSETYIEI